MKGNVNGWSIIVLIFLSTTVIGQGSPVKLGLRVAPNIGWMTSSAKHYEGDGVSGGVTAGFVSEFYFSEHYAFSTGFNFLFLNGKLKYPDVQTPEGSTVQETGILTRKYNFIYLEIPLMLKMKTKDFGKFDFFGQIGFGTGIRLKTKSKDSFQPETGDAVSSKNVITDQTSLIRESVLIGIGTEYHIDESTTLVVGVNYSNSLNNLLTGNNAKYPDVKAQGVLNYIELNIGVLF
jgi:hypothetical protein